MKLFSPLEVNNSKEKEISVGIQRLASLNKEITRKRQELEKLNLEFEISGERQNIQWEKDKAENAKICNALIKEVQILEERKKQALLPLTEKWKEIEVIEQKLKQKEVDLEEKDEKLSEQLELLEEKLSSLGEREINADKLGKQQAIAQEGIDSQKAQIALQAKQMNETIVKATIEAKARETAISKRESAIKLRELALEDKLKEIEQIEAGYASREKAIKDKYETLNRTLERIKNKKI